jgi:hypothetical protein
MHELTIIIFVIVLTIAIVLALKGSRDRATKFQEALLAGFLFFIFASPTAHAMSNRTDDRRPQDMSFIPSCSRSRLQSQYFSE